KATGTKFEDTNGDGVHQTDGSEGPLSGFVFFVDYNGNNQLDPGEPAAVSASDGTWQINGIKPGTWPVMEAQDPNFTCTTPSPCAVSVTFTAGSTQATGEWGNHPNQLVAPTTAPGQLVLGARITPGRARLLGPTGCQSRAVAGKRRRNGQAPSRPLGGAAPPSSPSSASVPSRSASAWRIASRRECTPSFFRMFLTCVRTVSGDRTRSMAMSAVDAPVVNRS